MLFTNALYNVLLFFGDNSMNLCNILSLLFAKFILLEAYEVKPFFVIRVPKTSHLLANSCI